MDSLDRIFGFVNEAKKAKAKAKGKGKAMIPTHKETPGGKKTPVGTANPYDHDHKPKKGKVNASTEIATILNLIKEAYQDELISEEAFLAIADPIMRSLMEVTFPDTYEKEGLDDAENEPKRKPKPKKTPMPTLDDYIAKHGEKVGREMYKRDGGKSSKRK